MAAASEETVERKNVGFSVEDEPSGDVVIGQAPDETGDDEEELINQAAGNEDDEDGSTRGQDAKAWKKLARKSSRRRKRPWYRHVGLKEHRRTVIVTMVIVFLAIAFVITGVVLLALHNFEKATVDGIVLLIAGLVMLIPGTYFTFFICMAARNRPGYNFSSLKRFSFN